MNCEHDWNCATCSKCDAVVTDQQIISRAAQTYCIGSDGDVVLNHDKGTPPISHGEDGAWVQAWVWVSYKSAEAA